MQARVPVPPNTVIEKLRSAPAGVEHFHSDRAYLFFSAAEGFRSLSDILRNCDPASFNRVGAEVLTHIGLLVDQEIEEVVRLLDEAAGLLYGAEGNRVDRFVDACCEALCRALDNVAFYKDEGQVDVCFGLTTEDPLGNETFVPVSTRTAAARRGLARPQARAGPPAVPTQEDAEAEDASDDEQAAGAPNPAAAPLPVPMEEEAPPVAAAGARRDREEEKQAEAQAPKRPRSSATATPAAATPGPAAADAVSFHIDYCMPLLQC